MRFYEELNRFLPPELRKRDIERRIDGNPPVREVIESLGVPSSEADLVLVNGESVSFDHAVRDGDRISVYPVFESFDIAGLSRVRARPLRIPRFVVDVHLGKLARILRMLGFDTTYRNDLADREIVDIASRETRIVLTRDRRLLLRRAVNRGYLVCSEDPVEQAAEVLRRFDLYRAIRPFRRCMTCNGIIEPVAKEEIADRLDPHTRSAYNEFFRCTACCRIYWKGSHYASMVRQIQELDRSRPGGSSCRHSGANR